MDIKLPLDAFVETIVKETLDDLILLETVKENIKYRLGTKELDFGSPEHVRILKGILHGLQNLRDCYRIGSANRHVYAATCGKLRRLIKKFSPEE